MKISSQPWPEYLIDAKFTAYDYGVREDSIRENLDEHYFVTIFMKGERL